MSQTYISKLSKKKRERTKVHITQLLLHFSARPMNDDQVNAYKNSTCASIGILRRDLKEVVRELQLEGAFDGLIQLDADRPRTRTRENLESCGIVFE